MSTLKNNIIINPMDLFAQIANTSTTAPYSQFALPLGALAVTGDGREFRCVQAGATALVIGTLQATAAPSSNLLAVTAVAAAAGATTTTLTISTGTAIVSGQFTGGYFNTQGAVSAGGGQSLKIASNTAVTSGGTSITFTLEDAVQAAITTSATVNIVPPQYTGLVQNPSSQVANVVGLAVNNLTANYYGWVQVKGIASALIYSTPAINVALAPSNNLAGAMDVVTGTTSAANFQVAVNLKTGISASYGPVSLLIS